MKNLLKFGLLWLTFTTVVFSQNNIQPAGGSDSQPKGCNGTVMYVTEIQSQTVYQVCIEKNGTRFRSVGYSGYSYRLALTNDEQVAAYEATGRLFRYWTGVFQGQHYLPGNGRITQLEGNTISFEYPNAAPRTFALYYDGEFSTFRTGPITGFPKPTQNCLRAVDNGGYWCLMPDRKLLFWQRGFAGFNTLEGARVVAEGVGGLVSLELGSVLYTTVNELNCGVPSSRPQPCRLQKPAQIIRASFNYGSLQFDRKTLGSGYINDNPYSDGLAVSDGNLYYIDYDPSIGSRIIQFDLKTNRSRVVLDGNLFRLRRDDGTRIMPGFGALVVAPNLNPAMAAPALPTVR